MVICMDSSISSTAFMEHLLSLVPRPASCTEEKEGERQEGRTHTHTHTQTERERERERGEGREENIRSLGLSAKQHLNTASEAVIISSNTHTHVCKASKTKKFKKGTI